MFRLVFASSVVLAMSLGQTIFRVPTGQAPCTTTISSGTSLQTTISGAAAGAVVCLEAGTYNTGTTLSGFTKSPSVTVRPLTTSTAVTINNLTFSGSVSGVTFDAYQSGAGVWFSMNQVDVASSGTKNNLLVRGVNSTSTTGQFSNIDSSAIVGGTSGVQFFTVNNVICSFAGGTDQRIIFDGNGSAGSQLFTFSRGTINGGGADGVRFGGSAGGIVEDTYIANVVEDPGFEDDCHSDGMQVFGGQNGIVRGNYFEDNVVGFAAYDGTAGFTISNNIFDNGSHGRDDAVEVYSDNGSTIDHNTLLHSSSCGSDGCAQIAITRKCGDDVGVNTIITNNIATNIAHPVSGPTTCTGSSLGANHHNLLRSGSAFAESGGVNTVGTPSYTGGTSPTTVAGYLLTAGSPGENAASDGSDIGVNIADVLASAIESRGKRSLLARVFNFRVPTPKRMPATYAAFQASVSLKYGEIERARAWVDTAQLIAGSR